MPECLSCQLIRKRDEGASPSWDNMYRSDYWDVVMPTIHLISAGWYWSRGDILRRSTQ